QEVFQVVARAIATFRKDRPGDSFRGWLWTVTLNKLRNYWQRGVGPDQGVGGTTAQQRLLEVPADESLDAEPSQTPSETHGIYQRPLELIQREFEERTVRAFLGVARDGRAAADVAAELGMTPGAVYIAKSRVLRRLREELAELV